MTDTADKTPADDAPTAADETASDPGEMHAGAPVTWSHGQECLHPTLETYLATVQALTEEGFVMVVDVTAVDYLERPPRELPPSIVPQRFEVVVNMLAMKPPRRIRLRLQVPEGAPEVPSLFSLYPGTEAMEREVFDLMGIRFTDHPDLTRILLPEEWEGHPLRKDYAMGRVPVQFKAALRGT